MKELQWLTDSYGRARNALYLGNLYVGSLFFHEDKEHHLGRPWRGWFMNDDEGHSVGWFTTADEARTAVQNAFHKATGI